MHLTYLLGSALFLIFGTGGETSTGKNNREDGTLSVPTTSNKKLSTMSINNMLNSRQLIELEQTVNTVYNRFFGPPPTKLTLRRRRAAKTILTIGKAIRDHIKKTMKDFGLNLTLKAAKYNLISIDSKPLGFSVFYELMRMPLEMRPIFQQIQNRINEYIDKNDYVKLGYKKANFSLKASSDNSLKEWQNLAISSASKIYTAKLYNCLERNNTTTFDLKKALGKLTNLAPEVVGQVLHRRLETALPKNSDIRKSEYTELHALVCHAISEDPRIAHRNCVVEMKRVEDCANDELRDSASDDARTDAAASSKDFMKVIESLDESCVDVPGTLGFSVKCKRDRRLLKSNEFAYVSDFLLGDMKKSPVLSGMAHELVSIVSNSRIGADVTREMATVVSVLQNAMEKRTKLAKSARKGVGPRYDGISKKLTDYEHHLARMSLKTINNVNEVVSNVEKILVDSTSKVSRRDLSWNNRALKCYSDLIESMFDMDWMYEPEKSKSKNGTAERNTRKKKAFVPIDSNFLWTSVGFPKKPRKESMKKWMNAMKHVGQSSSPRRPSALVTLANSFLLATMFYECIAVLAAVMNRDSAVAVSPNLSAENYMGDDWRSQGKKPSRSSDGQDHWSDERIS